MYKIRMELVFLLLVSLRLVTLEARLQRVHGLLHTGREQSSRFFVHEGSDRSMMGANDGKREVPGGPDPQHHVLSPPIP